MSVYGEIGTQGTQPLAGINSSFPPIPAVHFLCCGNPDLLSQAHPS